MFYIVQTQLFTVYKSNKNTDLPPPHALFQAKYREYNTDNERVPSNMWKAEGVSNGKNTRGRCYKNKPGRSTVGVHQRDGFAR